MSALDLDDPLLADLVAEDDRLLWETKALLEEQGIDFKAILNLVHPSLRIAPEGLRWIDQQPERPQSCREVSELLTELRAFEYHSIATMVELLLAPARPI